MDGPALKAVPKEKLQMVKLGEEAKVVGGEGCETGETLQVKINGETMIEIEDGRLFQILKTHLGFRRLHLVTSMRIMGETHTHKTVVPVMLALEARCLRFRNVPEGYTSSLMREELEAGPAKRN